MDTKSVYETLFCVGIHEMQSYTRRTIDQFHSPREVLCALHDVILAHGKLFCRTGKIHGNINPKTIALGWPGAKPGSQGYLLKPKPHLHNVTERTPSQNAKPNPIFQSISTLASQTLPRTHKLPPDYLDDLESLFYVLLWLTTTYTRPSRHSARVPAPIVQWASHPLSESAILSKERMFTRRGREGYAGLDAWMEAHSCFAGGVFADLVREVHEVLLKSYEEKMAVYRPRVIGELVVKATEDYAGVLVHFGTAMQRLEAQSPGLCVGVEELGGGVVVFEGEEWEVERGELGRLGGCKGDVHNLECVDAAHKRGEWEKGGSIRGVRCSEDGDVFIRSNTSDTSSGSSGSGSGSRSSSGSGTRSSEDREAFWSERKSDLRALLAHIHALRKGGLPLCRRLCARRRHTVACIKAAWERGDEMDLFLNSKQHIVLVSSMGSVCSKFIPSIAKLRVELSS
ncbi:hypothetical protein B0H34DRAFT_669803 [Crassisporium funariophilum]|nr:hypothetical protein B0H34DRAFT_669803 [Crassisporium funariophilum]